MTFKTCGQASALVLLLLTLHTPAWATDLSLRFIAKEKIDWRQGFLGEWNKDQVTKAYGVTGIPSLWLIDPDGKVISRNHGGEGLQFAVKEAIDAYDAKQVKDGKVAKPAGS